MCFCDNGLFPVGLALNWAVFVFSTCAKLKVTYVSVYQYLQLKCSIYRCIVDICTTTNYIPVIHHIQHWLIFNKFRGIGGVDDPAPTQPLCPEQMRYRHTQVVSTEPGSGHCENLPHTHSHKRYDRPRKYIYFFKWGKITIFGYQGITHTHTCAANTEIPHSVHHIGSHQNFLSEL